MRYASAVRRGEFSIYDIEADTRLYPDDVVILCASDSQIAEAEKILTKPSPIKPVMEENISGDGNMTLAEIDVPDDSLLCGKTLKDVAMPKKYGIKVMGVLHSGEVEPSQPDPVRPFEGGDKILCMGTVSAMTRMSGELKLVPHLQ